ncbi:glutathione S-transferase U20 [Lingula anatina]|uniref:Glutathione S-transferase U20 n=1 Tax=Lingula anatina TaxID=7574 RepID=A0A1S3HIY8_LINAN|nr:glutathione S-transferase U20 [Lingula anatina]XP_013385983.1 glutathione S-transferase U20 [Lingula anatina]|eukprot:XP_013385982.1 glutathione S-transferase U20 [Lingula anatina]
MSSQASDDRPHLYTAWHSPFGWRAWTSLLEKGVDFVYHETDPYDKSPEWFKISPRGLAPAIHHKGRAVYESTVCIEYIDEAWPHEPRLMPSDPYDRAYVRMWADHVNKKIIPHIFGMIVKQTPEEQEQAKKDALDGILAYTQAMRDGGPYFLGAQFSLADIVLGTFASIFFCMEHYRGFKVPETEQFARYHTWINAVKSRESWQKVLPSREKVLEDWRPYAEGKAQTELAKAARQGKTP